RRRALHRPGHLPLLRQPRNRRAAAGPQARRRAAGRHRSAADRKRPAAERDRQRQEVHVRGRAHRTRGARDVEKGRDHLPAPQEAIEVRMASSTSVSAFLATLPAERRKEVERVRKLIRKHLPAGYEEVVSNNMLVYQVPLKAYSDTYHGRPLWYAALASQKSYLSLHLMPVYKNKTLAQRLADGFRAAGKKLNMGQAC